MLTSTCPECSLHVTCWQVAVTFGRQSESDAEEDDYFYLSRTKQWILTEEDSNFHNPTILRSLVMF